MKIITYASLCPGCTCGPDCDVQEQANSPGGHWFVHDFVNEHGRTVFDCDFCGGICNDVPAIQ